MKRQKILASISIKAPLSPPPPKTFKTPLPPPKTSKTPMSPPNTFKTPLPLKTSKSPLSPPETSHEDVPTELCPLKSSESPGLVAAEQSSSSLSQDVSEAEPLREIVCEEFKEEVKVLSCV